VGGAHPQDSCTRPSPVGETDEDNGTSAAAVIIALLAEFDVESQLLAAGVSAGDLAAIRNRLRG
jgi:hypothetical protein